MSDRSWWPDGFRYPAFIVQRKTFGLEDGGDYVRGSSVETLPHTALRYPTQVEGWDEAKNKAFLYTRPFDYVTAEVGWGWPSSIEEKWIEVALVRSGFGSPVTVNDGQTVFRALKTDFTNEDDEIDTPPPIVYDTPLQSGRFYYYTLFFRTTPYDWIVGMTGSVLIPRNHKHAEHLWNRIPPFYQRTDSELREGNGPLRQFLSIFGFELDLTREYVEKKQEMYHIDSSPSSLLRRVGGNFGMTPQGGFGDIRYRALLAGLPEMIQMRGTPVSMQQVIQSGTKWQCDITLGTNIMLLPDDSDFANGVGNWATMHPATVEPAFNKLSYVHVDLGKSTTVYPFLANGPPPGYGTGVMRVTTSKAQELTDFMITCGNGVRGPNPVKEIEPMYTGIPVAEGSSYGFSVQISHYVTATTRPVMLWFGAGGKPTDYIGYTGGTPSANPDHLWYPYSVQGTAPEGAVYLVPALYITDRDPGSIGVSGNIDVAGALVYRITSSSSVSITPPDKYLTLGDPAELLGEQTPEDPDTTGFVLGEPGAN